MRALSTRAAFAASVFVLLIFSQAWVFPLAGEDAEAASGLIRNLFLPAYAAGLLVLASAGLDGLKTAVRVPAALLLVVLAFASAAWSADPDATIRRSVAVAFTTVCALALAARWSWPRVVEAIAAAFALLAVASLLAGLFWPGIGRMSDIFPGSWRGLWAEKNAMGGNMALGFVACAAAAAMVPERRKAWWAAACLCVALVLLSTSRTALIALLLGGAALGFTALVRRGPAGAVVTVWATATTAGAALFVLLLFGPELAERVGKDATLTGRTEIWTAAGRLIEQRPWTGWGYGAIWDGQGVWSPVRRVFDETGFSARHAHSAWVEMRLGLGLAGLALWSALAVEAVGRALHAAFARPAGWFALPFLAVYLPMTVTESVAFVWNDLRWVVFLIVLYKLAAPDRASTARP